MRAWETRGRRSAVVLLAAAALAVMTGALAQGAGVLGALEQDTVSLRFSLRGAEPPPAVAVVAIDDRTLDRLGVAWPLPRRLHARAIDRLRRAGARVIVYDVQFTEPTNPRDDIALYDAVVRARGMVLATTETDARGRTNVLGGDENLRAAGARAGAANFRIEHGDVIDRFDHAVGGLEALAVAAAEQATGRQIPAGPFGGGARIDYAGPSGTVPTVSFVDLVARRPPRGLLRRLRGRVVVVGASAASLQDVHATPVDGRRLMPGPEIQANAVQTVLGGLPLRDAPAWTAWVALVVLGTLPVVASLRVRVPVVALAAPVVAVAFLGVAQLAFDAGYVLVATYPVLALIAGTIAMAVAHQLLEQRERRRVTAYKDVLEDRVAERTRELHETQIELVERLAHAAESRDGDTGAHIERMSMLCERLALALGHTPAEAEQLRLAAALHDIGKIAVPDRVLLKPARLDADEWRIMQSHTTQGADLLAGSRTPLVRLAEQIARSHHERWDGTGHPAGLAGAQIPFAARITAVCDVFDALTSRRPYKDAWSFDDAVAAVVRGSGTQFDPAVVRAFEATLPDLRAALAATGRAAA